MRSFLDRYFPAALRRADCTPNIFRTRRFQDLATKIYARWTGPGYERRPQAFFRWAGCRTPLLGRPLGTLLRADDDLPCLHRSTTNPVSPIAGMSWTRPTITLPGPDLYGRQRSALHAPVFAQRCSDFRNKKTRTQIILIFDHRDRGSQAVSAYL